MRNKLATMLLLGIFSTIHGCKTSESSSRSSEENAAGQSGAEDSEATDQSVSNSQDAKNTTKAANDKDTLGLVVGGGPIGSRYDDPFLICNSPGCEAGAYRRADSQILATFYSKNTGKPLANKSFRYQIYDWSGSRVGFQQMLTTNASGYLTSGKIGNARGHKFRICLVDEEYGTSGSSYLTVLTFPGEAGCYTGTLASSGKDTYFARIDLTEGASTNVDVIELVKTGSYCPANPIIIQYDSFPALDGVVGVIIKSLGFCRNLDSQIYGTVVNAVTGDVVGGARIDVVLGDLATTGLSDSFFGGSDGKFVSSKYSRMRGKAITICATATNFSRECQTSILSANGKDTVFEGTTALKIYPNQEPVSSVAATGTQTAEGAYKDNSVITGWSVDSDHANASLIRITAGGITKEFLANEANDIACAQVSAACGRDNIAFSYNVSNLGLAPGYYDAYVFSFNPVVSPQPQQSSTELQWVLLNGSPIPLQIYTIPAAPTNLTAVASGIDIALNWNDNSTAEKGFSIYRKTGGGSFTKIADVGANVTTFNDNSLAISTLYSYKVSAWNEGGSSDSVEASATTAAAPADGKPKAASNLTATVNGSAIDLRWTDNSNDERGFAIYRLAGGAWAKLVDTAANATSYKDTNVQAGIQYTYDVRAWNNYGSAVQARVIVTIPIAIPTDGTPIAPTNLTAVANAGAVDLKWTDNSSNESGFAIYRLTGSTWVKIVDTAANATSYKDTGVQGGTQYTYDVRAWNSKGNSPQARAVVTTPASGPAAPSNFKATPGSRRITLTWTDNANNESGFRIYRKTGNSAFTQIATPSANAKSYTNTGLAARTTYSYEIRSWNAAGVSAPAAVSAKTP